MMSEKVRSIWLGPVVGTRWYIEDRDGTWPTREDAERVLIQEKGTQ